MVPFEDELTLLREAVALLRAQDIGKEPGRKRRTNRGTVNERMAATILHNNEALGWNSPQWAAHLKCAKSTVVETTAWKILESVRMDAKCKRVSDRRRKTKASDSQRKGGG
jgi:hypothetical protein